MVQAKALHLSTFKLFNEAQVSAAAHHKSAKLLWQLQQKDSDKCYEELCTCLRHTLLLPQVTFSTCNDVTAPTGELPESL